MGSPLRALSFLHSYHDSAMPSLIRITAGPYTFLARFEEQAAPLTVARFRTMLVRLTPL